MTGPSAELVPDSTGPRVLSVGTAGGITSGFDGLPDGGGLVRLGDDILSIDEEQYRLWDSGLLAPKMSALLQWAAHAGIDRPDEQLRELLTDHLMVEQARDPDELLRQAAAHAVRFIGYFIGNGPSRSPRFLVKAGAEASSVLAIDVVLYQFLLRADGTVPIAELCARLDIDGMPDDVDPARHVMEQLPVLLRAGVIGLEPHITDEQMEAL